MSGPVAEVVVLGRWTIEREPGPQLVAVIRDGGGAPAYTVKEGPYSVQLMSFRKYRQGKRVTMFALPWKLREWVRTKLSSTEFLV